MSENSNCNNDCVIGSKKVETKLPNLVSAKEVVKGKRPCKGKKPFNVPWCHRIKGWPAGSMVYNNCGYFFNTERAYGDPCDAGSEWIEFDFKFLFTKLLESMACESCPTIDGDVKPWILDGKTTNIAQPGETWCFTVIEDDGTMTEVYACALEEDLLKNPIEKPEAWTPMQSPKQIMCSLLTPEEIAVDNDTTCTIKIESTNSGLLFTEVCKDADGEVISEKELYTIPNDAMDLFGTLEPSDVEGEDGKLYWTPAGGGDKLCVYDCKYIDDLECKLCPWNSVDKPLIYSDSTSVGLGGKPWETVVSGTPRTVSEVTITKAEAVALGMPECHNSLFLSIATVIELNGVDGQPAEAIAFTQAEGCNKIGLGPSVNLDTTGDTEDETVRERNSITFDNNDEIKLRLVVSKASPSSSFEDALVKGDIKIFGSEYAKCS